MPHRGRLAPSSDVKPLLLALCLAGCYRGATPTADESIALKQPVLHVGQRWSELSSSVWAFEAIGGGERWPASFTQTTNRTVEVLEVSDGIEARSRHTYLVDHERKAIRHDGPRDEEAAPTALQGNTYVLSATQVTMGDGGAVPEDQVALVRERDPRFGKPDRMQAWLHKRLVKDRPMRATATELASYSEPGKQLTKFEVTFRGQDGKRILLDVTTAFHGDAMEAELTGRYVVDAETGMDLSFDLAGPMTYRGDGVELRGRMHLTQQRTL